MTLTRWIIVGIVVIVSAIDVVLAVRYGINATISVTISAWSKQIPFIPFCGGVLCGHFWAQNE